MSTPLDDEDPRHGRTHGYRLGCRCVPCREAKRASDASSYAAHREERNASSASYRITHREELAAYRAARRDETAVYNAAYSAAHREERAAYNADHREERSAYNATYHAANPDKGHARRARRRARLRGNATVPYSRAYIIARDLLEGCYLCSLPFDPTDVHVDHIDPLDNGGDDASYNVAATHPACNLSKGARPWPRVYVLAAA